MDMRTHYEHIHDPALIKEWADHVWKPEKRYLVMLAARKKYDPTVKVKRAFIMRKDIFNRPGRLAQSVKQYEFPLDALLDDNGVPVKQQALVTYVTPNPRDTFVAACEMSRMCLEYVRTNHHSKQENKTTYPSVVGQAKTALQKCAEEVPYLTIDVDDKAIGPTVDQFLRREKFPIHCLVETRGGFHVLLRTAELTKHHRTILWKEKTEQWKDKVEIHKDQVTPLPGTVQGGFPVRFAWTSWNPPNDSFESNVL